jgi:hypothetical protein
MFLFLAFYIIFPKKHDHNWMKGIKMDGAPKALILGKF